MYLHAFRIGYECLLIFSGYFSFSLSRFFRLLRVRIKLYVLVRGTERGREREKALYDLYNADDLAVNIYTYM